MRQPCRSRWRARWMVEPTESEGKRLLDRFIDAMLAIRADWTVKKRVSAAEDNPLVNAPHIQSDRSS
ncbi:hypothetical protein KCP77_06310 [Salmonella enterica subsp. enterica]|nr:hypothetical protein KCP77_06310 [Salmonella enterica subsp. enterica]